MGSPKVSLPTLMTLLDTYHLIIARTLRSRREQGRGKLNGTQEDELISPFGECPLTLSCFGKKETTKKEEKP